MNKSDDIDIKPKYVFMFLILVVIVIGSFSSFTIVPPGSKGVVFSKADGVQEQIFSEGFHIKKPLIDEVIMMDVRTKKAERKLASTSSDQQTVTASIVVNYRPNSDQVNKLFQEVGLDYESKVINPAIEESVKSAMAQYKAINLLQDRQLVSQDALEILRSKVEDKYLTIEKLNIVNIEFTDSYKKSIEAKVVAEQNALKAENDLERIQIEAKQIEVQAQAQKNKTILEAQGNAEARILRAEAEAKGIELLKQAAKDSDEVVQLKWVESWNGQVPKIVTGDNSGMILGLGDMSNLTR